MWMAFFKNPMDLEALKDKKVFKAWERLKYLSADEKVRAEYDARNDAILDELSRWNSIIEEREILAREEERAKAYQEKIESAKQMLEDGIPINLVAKYSGLSVEEIRGLP